MTDPVFRRSGLGGTDVAAILGLHPQRDAFSVYAEKCGLIQSSPGTARMRWGSKLQRVIAEAWTETTGKPHEWVDQTRRGNAADFQIYTPDAMSLADARGIECKTAGLDRAHLWGDGPDDVPAHYALQCHWYMSAASVPFWDIALLIAGSDFRIYTIQKDAEVEALILAEAEKFWRDHILTRLAPAPGPTRASIDALKQMFPKNTANLRPAKPEELPLIEALREAKAKENEAEAALTAAKGAIQLAIGEADGLELSPKERITWKLCKDTMGTDWQKIAQIVCEANRLAGLIAANQIVVKKGSRRLITPRSWGEE